MDTFTAANAQPEKFWKAQLQWYMSQRMSPSAVTVCLPKEFIHLGGYHAPPYLTAAYPPLRSRSQPTSSHSLQLFFPLPALAIKHDELITLPFQDKAPNMLCVLYNPGPLP